MPLSLRVPYINERLRTHLLSSGAGAGPPPLLAVLRPLHLCSRGRGPNLDLQLQLRPAHRTQVILPAISGLISVLRIRPGIRCIFDPWIRDGKKSTSLIRDPE
jgi:hypothetical protein